MNPFLPPGQQKDLVLASRSPRRIEIMRGLGFEFEVEPAPEHLEDGLDHDDPFAIPQLLAARKCVHVSERRPKALVIAADTVVIVDDRILNKPANDAEARGFLRSLAGRTHVVVTGLAIVGHERGVHIEKSARTFVTFRELSDDEIARYVATGEGRDKAGSYAAQGVGAGLIRTIDGCFFNVVGLPVSLLIDMLREV
ncbi:MAG: Maf family protein [Candidatus Latescibacteria bacterium]|nr:Maf family protein [Candidatus Latescibacterota bacterium]